MLKKIKYQLAIQIIALFINSQILTEGFISGTLIKTKNKYVPIEQLKENDSVICYSFKNKELYESKILKVKKQHYDKAIKIKSSGIEIIAAPDHKFYLPLHPKKRWVFASELRPKDSILKNVKELIEIDEIIELKETDFYCLSIHKYHNFFITQQDILVHNFAFTIPIFTWIIGEGIVWAGLATCAAATTAVVINEIAKNNNLDCSGLTQIDNVKVSFNDNQYNHIINNPDHGFLNNMNYNGPDPDEWWKKILEIFDSTKKHPEKFQEGVPSNINTGIFSKNPKFGELIVRVFKANGTMKLSTAFLKMITK